MAKAAANRWMGEQSSTFACQCPSYVCQLMRQQIHAPVDMQQDSADSTCGLWL